MSTLFHVYNVKNRSADTALQRGGHAVRVKV